MPDDGFYLPMLAKHEAVDTATQQCYSQLCNKLGYFDGTVQVTVGGKKVPLSLDAMAATPDPDIEKSGRAEFHIFRMTYIKVFDDGSLMLKLIKDVCTAMGTKADAIDDKLKAFAGKSHSSLRAVYWYIDKNFISKMPPIHQVSFSVDCLMFGSWQANSRNLIGMHLVALAWMLDVKPFAAFLPPDLTKHAAITSPPFKGFLEKKAIVLAINFKDVKSAGAGAGVAKVVDKTAATSKGAKDDKKGAKDDKKGAKDDKKGAKDDKKGAKGEKKGAKDDKKGAKAEKKGAKDDKKGAKGEKKGAKDDKKGAKGEKKGAKK